MPQSQKDNRENEAGKKNHCCRTLCRYVHSGPLPAERESVCSLHTSWRSSTPAFPAFTREERSLARVLICVFISIERSLPLNSKSPRSIRQTENSAFTRHVARIQNQAFGTNKVESWTEL